MWIQVETPFSDNFSVALRRPFWIQMKRKTLQPAYLSVLKTSSREKKINLQNEIAFSMPREINVDVTGKHIPRIQ